MTRPHFLRLVRHPVLVGLTAFCAAGAFMVFIGWPLLIEAALQEAETRHMQRVMIAISRLDRACLQWAERGDGAWICVKR